MKRFTSTTSRIMIGAASLALGLTTAHAQTASSGASRTRTKAQVKRSTPQRGQMRATALHEMQTSAKNQVNKEVDELNQPIPNPYPRYDKPFIFETRRYRRDLEWERPIGNTPRYMGLYYF